MTDVPFTLPLEPAELRHALRSGHGRALLHFRTHARPADREILLEACARCVTYDAQIEGCRVDWLLEMIDGSGAEEWLRLKILAALPRTADTWDGVQACRLAAAFARRGDEAARRALYAEFDRQRLEEGWVGGKEIIELDGLAGYLHVAERLGRRLREDPQRMEDPVLLEIACERLGEQVVRAALEREAATNPNVAAYRDAVLPDSAARRRSELHRHVDALPYFLDPAVPRSPAAYDFDAFRATVEDPEQAPRRGPAWYFDWARRARPEDVLRAAHALYSEQDVERLRRWLLVFKRSSIPVYQPRLLEFLSHPDEEVREATPHVLSSVAHQDVRAAAADRLSRGLVDEATLRMLTRNYQPGDAAPIVAGLPVHAEPDAVHHLASLLVDLYGKNPVDEGATALLWAYERSPCSLCRQKAVEQLLKLDALPAWAMVECRADALESIRVVVAAAAATR